jgi:(4-O-methyl)-D-glucuronate---lignin esterase
MLYSFSRSAVLIMVAIAIAAATASAQTAPHASGPDPKEIPIPEIKTDLGKMPGVDELPVLTDLPDPMVTNDGAKVTTKEQWTKRREEIKRTLEYYAVGRMPPPPGNVKGVEVSTETVLDGKVKYRLVHLTFGPEEKLSLDIGIFTPVEGGPFPTIISQSGAPPGAKPLPRLPPGPNQGRGQDVLMMVGPAPGTADSQAATGQRAITTPPRGFGGGGSAQGIATANSLVFQRGYALVVFNPNDCAEDTTLRNADGSWAFRNTRFMPAYPGYDWGILAAWAWGASRIADYLVTDPAIDKTKMIITGASRNGKSSMIAAAFDDRLMGAPVVTGGGGIGAYRFAGPRKSETLDVMQKKYPNWFSPHLHEFWGQREKLPFDEHWFLALAAPRPFIALEGDTDTISLPDAVKHSIEAAQKVYEFLGAKDNIGVHYSHHGHAFTQEDWAAMLDFFDKYSRGMKVDKTFDHFLPDVETDAPAPTSPASAPAASAPKIYNVRDFGTVGDGTNKDTIAFQKALDTCAVNGGGEVFVPAGNYLIGSVQIGTRTTVRLDKDATLTGTIDLDDYPIIDVRWEGRWQRGHRALIYAANVDHVGIIGPGHITASFGRPGRPVAPQPANAAADAAAAQPGDPARPAPSGTPGSTFTRGPLLIEPISCNDVRFEDFTGDHVGTWANHPTYCTNVVFRNLKLSNTSDGLDIDSCDGVVVDHCVIDAGDDAISIKSGRGMDGARLAKICKNILITNCSLSDRTFACIGLGSEMSGGVSNVRVEHCKFLHSGPRWYSIYIKTRPGRAGTTENITLDDIDVADAGGFLRINTLNGGNTSTVDDAVEGDAGIPLIKNIRVSNIRVKNVANLVAAFQTNPKKPIEGLTLENITGDCAKGIALVNVNNAVLKGIDVTGYAGPLLATDNVTGTGLEGAVKYTGAAK